MRRVLLLATTTGYQTRAFGDAAERLGVDLVFATDRCNVLDDPWQDAALAIRFHHEGAAIEAIARAAVEKPIDGVLAVGDRPSIIAAAACEVLNLPWHPLTAVTIARSKRLTRERLRDAGLPAPWFRSIDLCADPRSLLPVDFPCVVKPVALTGSRGVMRANDEPALVAAFNRLRSIVKAPDIRGERSGIHDTAVVEGFIAGREFAVEGLMTAGRLRILAIFDKPDPLDGPFFEETIYVTPSSAPSSDQAAIISAVTQAVEAIGLRHGPIHAECRLNLEGVFVLEVAARPIGGLCARVLRFIEEEAGLKARTTPEASAISFEELLLRHAIGQNVTRYEREQGASAVMMIPIPRRGVLRGVAGIDQARAVRGIDDLRITAKPDQVLVPLPEGNSYLGFIFAHADEPSSAVAALRAAHARLVMDIEPEVRVLQSVHG
jgi:biotin carboxylase